MPYKVKKTEFGFYSIYPLPSASELKKHYSEKYYQNRHGNYQSSYTSEELMYFKIEAMVAESVFKRLSGDATNGTSLLDVGAGEGFFSKYFYDNGYNIISCDFSDKGMITHNYTLTKTLIKGDIFETLKTLFHRGDTYDFMNVKNVLEHVLYPVDLLKYIKKLLKDNSIVRIEVPNDYSAFQNMLLNKNMTQNTWVSPPEHLHYFNFENIKTFLKAQGFSIRLLMSDFPIELYLLNQYSNYAKNKNIGKEAHFARVRANQFIYNQGIEHYIDYFSAAAKVNMGRQVIAYVSKSA